MNLIRLLAIAALIWIIYRMVQTRRRNRGSLGQRPGSTAVENMVKCEHCGLHIPQAEAVYGDGKAYCSREHLEAAQR